MLAPGVVVGGWLCAGKLTNVFKANKHFELALFRVLPYLEIG